MLKPYKRINFKDHVVDLQTKAVIQQGVPLSANNMRQIEDAIESVTNEAITLSASSTTLGKSLEALDAASIPQTAIALPEGVDPNVDNALGLLLENTAEVEKQLSNKADTKDIPKIIDASTEAKGIVQLSNSIDSDSETEAATPSAVKAVHEATNTKLNNSGDTMNGELIISDRDSYLTFGTSRPWQFKQSGYGNSSGLSLVTAIEDKSFYISNSAQTRGFRFLVGSNTALYPIADNQVALGASGNRFKEIVLGSSPIVSSDERLKEDIIPMSADIAIAFIKELNPVQYKYIDGTSGRTHYGLGARQVKATMDDLGITDKDFAGWINSPIENEDGETVDYVQGLRYEEFIPLLIKVVQGQQKDIEALKTAK